MKIALLGAGFSRNWGGLLASEVLARLLGRLDRTHPDLHRMLVERRNFEEVLGTVQQDALRGAADAIAQLEAMETAIQRVFDEMNGHFARNILDLDVFSRPNLVARSVHAFLARFDAIFSLNQDLLLECHYRPELRLNNRWPGWYEPGIVFPAGWRDRPAIERIESVLPIGDYEEAPNLQPIYKLHGSVNWRSQRGLPLMIVGSGKAAAIDGDLLLRRYFAKFQECLLAGDTRIVAIGYSFSDRHIDDAIEAAGQRGLRMFVLNPSGLDALDRLPRGAVGYSPGPLSAVTAGFSIRQLAAIFGDDDLEREALEQFIEG